MAKIIFNQQIDNDIYYIEIAGKYKGSMGQFYMLRGWATSHPLLNRPFSIFDLNDHSISFIYKVVGEGTQLLSKLRKNNDLELFGPYGNGFPLVEGKIALVGGGMGIAPLYLAARELMTYSTTNEVHIYLGFKENAILTDLFEAVSHKLIVDTGGYISEIVNVNSYDYVFACGPQDMEMALMQQKNSENTHIFFSVERRMGCGIGACLSCTCKTSAGNKLTCKDGPVFPGEVLLFE